MSGKRKLLLVLLSSIIFSCNNPESTESNNTAVTDTIANQTIEKVITQDTLSVVKQNKVVSIISTSQFVKPTIKKESKVNKSQLEDLYKKFEKTPQTFSISTDKDTTIICAEGTTIKIKANSFVSEITGIEITNNIQIAVKEYYKLSDMLLANLSTTSDCNLLETAGMINITASADNVNCILKQGEKIEIGMPSQEPKNDMQLFSGDSSVESVFNWEPMPNSTNLNKIYTKVDQLPAYPGGSKKLKEFLNENAPHPKRKFQDLKQGTVFIRFVVMADGSLKNARVEKGLDFDYDKIALDAVNHMPNFIPGKINGEPVNVNFGVTVFFYLNDYSTYDTDYAKDFEMLYTDSTLQNADVKEISKYLFSSTKLGWINCDHWQNTAIAKVNFTVNLNTEEECSTTIIFHRIKSIMNGIQTGNYSSCSNIPAGEEITLIAIKYINDQPYLAIKETLTSSHSVDELSFEPVSMEKLKGEMEKLNNMN